MGIIKSEVSRERTNHNTKPPKPWETAFLNAQFSAGSPSSSSWSFAPDRASSQSAHSKIPMDATIGFCKGICKGRNALYSKFGGSLKSLR